MSGGRIYQLLHGWITVVEASYHHTKDVQLHHTDGAERPFVQRLLHLLNSIIKVYLLSTGSIVITLSSLEKAVRP